MLLWFVGTAVVAVGFVFRDPRFDYRLLVVGAVVPLLDAVLPGVRPLHSVTTAVALLTVLMLVTAGRRPIRRMLLGLPIGMILHLVFDAAWADTDTFWWPFTGFGFDDESIPALERGWVSVGLEAVGVAICVWLVRRNALATGTARRAFLATGRLDVLPADR